MGLRFRRKVDDRFRNIIEHRLCKSRIDSDPEYIVHDIIRVRQLSNNSIFAALVSWLPEKIAAEEKPRSDLLCVCLLYTSNKLGIILLPWLAAAAGVLLAKRSMLAHGEQTPLFEIALSLRTPPSLHFWEKASLFRSDIMCYFFFVPLVFGLLTSRLSARWRVFIVILGSLLVEVLVYSEVITFYATGAFTSLISMWIAVGWAIKSHTTAFVSIHAITLFKIVSMLVVVGFFSLIALIALRANLRWLNHASLAVFGIVSMMGVIAWIPNTPAMPWTHTLLQMTATPAIFDSTLFSRRSGSVEDLLNELSLIHI